MRAKWSAPIRKYWKISEQMMVKYCDLAICDSVNIEKYIHECYDGKGIQGRNPKTTFIAYGADLTLSKLADDDEKLVSWYKEKGLTKKGYYLVVGRFVPENSFEVMIREFMKSKSQRNFAIITNVNDKFLNELEEKLHFKSDKRIKFVGTVYDQELLKKIRENAYEDNLFLSDVFDRVDKVPYSKQECYGYRHRANSITTKHFSEKDLDIIDIGNELVRRYEYKSRELSLAVHTYQVTNCLRVYLTAPGDEKFRNDINYCREYIELHKKEILKNTKARNKLKIALLIMRLPRKMVIRVRQLNKRWN